MLAWDLFGVKPLGTLDTNFDKIQIEIQRFAIMKMKIPSANHPPVCYGLNVLSD